MLSVSAQHSRKHRKQQKTAVAQSVEPQTTVKGKGKKAVNAINNNNAVALAMYEHILLLGPYEEPLVFPCAWHSPYLQQPRWSACGAHRCT